MLLVPLAVTPYFIGLGGIAYAVASVGASAPCSCISPGACARSRKGARPTRRRKKLFGFSILYLFLLFAVLLAEHAVARLVA